MPTVKAPAKILVSGVNGYVALWIVFELLERGYHVRGTVRSARKGDEVVKTVETKLGDPQKAKCFEYVIVDDIATEGAFDDAVKDIEGIVHVATATNHNMTDREAFMKPAIGGTLGVLKSALKCGPSVKRIVVTSSTGAITTLYGGYDGKPLVFTEDDWNDEAVKIVEGGGKDIQSHMFYLASKVLSERAAWDFYNEHKGQAGWDLTVVHPSYVFGPAKDDPPSMTKSAASMSIFATNVILQSGDLGESVNFVNVRDVAEGHIKALEVPEAGGERIILSNRPARWQEWIDATLKLKKPLSGLPKGQPGKWDSAPYPSVCVNAKAQRILGLRFRTLEESLEDIVADFRARGWINHLE